MFLWEHHVPSIFENTHGICLIYVTCVQLAKLCKSLIFVTTQNLGLPSHKNWHDRKLNVSNISNFLMTMVLSKIFAVCSCFIFFVLFVANIVWRNIFLTAFLNSLDFPNSVEQGYRNKNNGIHNFCLCLLFYTQNVNIFLLEQKLWIS